MATTFYLLEKGIGSGQKRGVGPQAAFKKSLCRFTDPLTPPQSKTDCIHTIEPIPGVILCDGWETKWRHMEVEYFVLVYCPTPQDLENIVVGCLQTAAVAALLSGLVAAILSGGSAGVEAAKVAFVAALEECLRSHLQDFRVEIISESHWTDWV